MLPYYHKGEEKVYRVVKSLNNNSVLAVDIETMTEVIILGRGVGFGKKVNERFEAPENTRIYALQKETDRGKSHSLALSIDPIYFEITSAIVQKAQETMGELDENVLLPLADHIDFAVKRIKRQGYINNPMTHEIYALFPNEFAAAEYGKKLIEEKCNVTFNQDEMAYIALHLHGAADNQKVSEVMKQTQVIRDCLETIEEKMQVTLDPSSLSYNRLLSHMKYMLARMIKEEQIELDMNDFIKHQYPKTFALAKSLCERISKEIGLECKEEEIGYLAIHIERVCMKNTNI
jgi:transcriptional antiterminator